ncbi:MAG: hypothetical protein WBI17_02455 [Clostridiaceae bacterium]
MAINKLVALFDKTLVKHRGWKHLPGSEHNFLYFVPEIYKGKDVIIKDGTIIRKGDKILEIHIDNPNLINLDTGYSSLFTMLKGELINLGKMLPEKEYEEYKAVLAITLLHRLASRAGFTVFEFESSFNQKMVSLGENILRATLRKEKEDKNKKKKKRIAKVCWISRNEIMNLEKKDVEKE